MKNRKKLYGNSGALSSLLVVGIAALFALGSMGCEDPLDVENPNDLLEQDLQNPTAAAAIASGALRTTSVGVGYCLAPLITATDEVTWIGSRDAWRELDFGNVAFAGNEFTDNAMKFLHEGRWTSDNAVTILSGFKEKGELEDDNILARAHLLAGLTRVYIADWFDDWTFSDKTEPAPNLGKANMRQVYEDAIAHLTAAFNTATDDGLKADIISLRARAKHAMAIWDLLNPAGSTPANGFVDAGADDAQQALGLMGSNDYRFQLTFGSGQGDNDFSWQVNGRRELTIGAIPVDPISGSEDPRAAAAVAEFKDSGSRGSTDWAPITVTSAAEMHLIIAESLYAQGDTDAARNHLNVMRTAAGLPEITTEDVGDMIVYERHANLFIQGRRLNDMYRFGIQDPMWQTTSDAYTQPGVLLPITDAELQSNPLIDPNR